MFQSFYEGEKLPLFGDLKRFAEPPSQREVSPEIDDSLDEDHGDEIEVVDDNLNEMIDDEDRDQINKIVNEVVKRETRKHNVSFSMIDATKPNTLKGSDGQSHLDGEGSLKDKVYNFKCPYCYVDQCTLERLRSHMQDGCPKRSQMSSFREKIETAPSTGGKFKGVENENLECDFCEYKTTTSNKADLRTHLQVVHKMGIGTKPKPVNKKLLPAEKQCPICEYTSSQKSVLDNHIRIVHLELREIQEKARNQEQAMNRRKHFPGGTQEGNAIERNGGPPQLTPTSLKVQSKEGHQNIDIGLNKNPDGDRIRCPQCNFEAAEKSLLDKHIQAEHAKMRDIPYAIVYACVECDYGALDAVVLKEHMRAIHNHPQRKDLKPVHVSSVKTNQQETCGSPIDEENSDDEVKLPTSTLLCNNCDFNTSLRKDFIEHIQSNCSAKKEYEDGFSCLQCPFQTPKNYILKAHIEERHSQNPSSFDQETNLSANNVHNNSKLEIKAENPVYAARSPPTNLVYAKKSPPPKGKNESRKITLDKGLNLENKIKTFCSECGFHSSNTKVMEAHNIEAHSEKPEYRPIRVKNFHILKLVNKKKKKSAKEISVETMTLKEMFKEIKEVYDAESNILFQCPIPTCGHQIFKTGRTSKGNMNTHIRRRHYNMRNSSCPKCDYSAFNRQSLDNHIRQVHDKEKNFQCSFKGCDFKSFNTSNLANHVKSVHTKIKDVECPRCDYKTSNSANLYQHIKGKHNKIKDKCCDYEGCNYKATLGGDLKRHIKAVHMKIRLACPYCEHTAPYEAGLQAHIKYVHEQVAKDIKCELCGYATYQDSKLKKHIKLVHERCKGLVCDVCLRYSSDDYRKLKRHKRLRHNEVDKSRRSSKRGKGRKIRIKKKVKSEKPFIDGYQSACLDWA